MTKNVQRISKICLWLTLYIEAYFVEFYVFVLDKIHVRGSKLIEGYVWVVNIRENIPKDHPRVLEEGPMLVAKIAQGSPTCGWQTTASCLVDAP